MADPKVLQTLPREGDYLVVEDGGRLKHIRIVHQRRWWFWFQPFAMQEVIKSLRFEQLRRHLTGDFWERGLERLKQRLLKSVTIRFATSGQEAIQEVVSGIQVQLQENVLPAITSATPEVTSPYTQSKGLIDPLTEKAVSRLRQEISTLIGDATLSVMNEVVEEVIANVRKAIDGQKVYTPLLHGENLLPTGCRMILHKGQTMIVVIEESPQVRTVLFDAALAKSYANSESSLQVAFPYIVYVIEFQGGSFNSMYMFYNTQPMKSLDDNMYRPNLPNTKGHFVCLNFPGHQSKCKTLASRVEEVIAYWWQSRFKDHWLSENWDPSRLVDSRIRDFKAWEAASKSDPMFVLRVPWLPSLSDMPSPKRVVDAYLKQPTLQLITGTEIETAVRAILAERKPRLQLEIARICEEAKANIKVPELVDRALSSHLRAMAEGTVQAITTRLTDIGANTSSLQASVKQAVTRSLEEVLNAEFSELADDEVLDQPLNLKQFVRASSTSGEEVVRVSL